MIRNPQRADVRPHGGYSDSIAPNSKNAADVRDEIAQLIEGYQRQVDDLQRKIAGLRKAHQALAFDELAAKGTTPHVETPDGFASRRRERRESKAWIVRKQAYVILKDAGRPLSSRRLFEALKEKGFLIDGPHPAKLIGKILWAAEEFEHRTEGYWIAGEPFTESPEDSKRDA